MDFGRVRNNTDWEERERKARARRLLLQRGNEFRRAQSAPKILKPEAMKNYVAPSTKIREKPNQSFFNRVRDVFDANTESDKYRRALAGQPEDYTAQQKQLQRNNVQSIETNPFKRVYQEVTEAPRRVGVGLSRNTTQQDETNKALLREQEYAANNIIKAGRKIKDPTVSNEEKLRWINYYVKTYPEQFYRDREIRGELEKYVRDADPVAGLAALAEMGIDVLTLGLGGKAATTAIKTGAKQALKTGAKSAGSGALGGAVGTVTARGSEVTPQELAVGAGAGGLLGSVLPAAGALIGRLTRKGVNANKLITELAQETDQTAVRKQLQQLEGELSTKQLDELSGLIAKQSDQDTILATIDGYLQTAATPQRVQRGARGDVEVDQLTDRKLGELVDRASATELLPGMRRLYQVLGKDQESGYYFDNIDDLAFRQNNITSKTDKFNFVDVPEGAVTEVPGKPGVYQLEKLNEVAEANTPEPAVKANEEIVRAVEETPPSAQIATASQTDATEAGTTSIAKDIEQGKDFVSVEKTAEDARIKAEAEKNRYPKETVVEKLKRVWDRRTKLYELDRKYAKLTGRKYSELNADEKLDVLAQVSANSDQQARAIIQNDTSIPELVQKYGADTKEAVEFNYYRVAKHDLERRLDGRSPIISDESTDNLRKYIAEYEARNPEAQSDLLKLVKDIEDLQVQAALDTEAGYISMADVLRTRSKRDGAQYQFYTPIQRAAPTETLRPTINSKSIGTISRQNVLRQMKGSERPVDMTFDEITDYFATTVRDLNRSRLAKKFATRVKEGLVDRTRVVQDAEDFAAVKELRKTINELTADQKKLKTKTAQARFKKSKANTARKQAEREATTKFRKVMRDSLDDQDAKAAINDATPEEILDYLVMLEEEPNSPSVRRVRSNLQKKSEAHAKLSEELDDLRLQMRSMADDKRELRKEVFELREDETTGLQTITGLDTDGNKFKIEVPPEYSRVLQGLGEDNPNNFLRKLQVPFRQAYTGIANPSFQLKQGVFNALMLPLIDKNGLRTWGPRAVAAGLKSFRESDEFLQLLRKHGAVTYGGGFSKLPSDTAAEALASGKDIISQLKWNKNPKRAWQTLERWGGKIDQAARTNAGQVAFDQAKKKGLSDAQAIGNAVDAYNNVLPDFVNLSPLVRNVDSVLMYSGATQAGTRTLLRAARNNPVQFASKLGGFGLAVGGIGAYNMAHDAGQEFYLDMMQNDKGYVLDSNIPIVLPGASKDEETGQWSGVVLIPVAPELRPVTSGVWKSFFDEDGASAKEVALATFDFLTGQSRQTSTPVGEFIATAYTGKEPNGREIYDPDMDSQEKITALIKSLGRDTGVPGRVLTGQGEPGDILASIVKPYYGVKGSTEGSRAYKRRAEAISEVGLNKNELEAFNSTIWPSGKDQRGNDISDKTYYDSASRATTWLRYPKTFEVSRAINQKAAEAGLPTDPLFELEGQQLQLVLNMMANYSPGNYEEKAIRQLNPWIDDFNERRSEFFDSLNDDLSPEEREQAGYDPMGLKRVTPSPEMEQKLAALEQITDGAARAQFYEENPDVTEYFSDINSYQRAKREFLGLPQFDDYPQASEDVQSWMDEYNELPSKNGPLKRDGTPSSPDRSAWIKANPDKWAQMTEYWTALDFYNLQKEGALAVYEGIDFTEDGLKSIQDISKYLDGQSGGGYGSGYGYGYGGGNYEPYLNIDALLRNVGATGTAPPKIDTTPNAPKLRFKPAYSKSKPSVIKFKT